MNKFGSPYRNNMSMVHVVLFSDFMNYYGDAKAIGFSNRKAMKYALNCCMDEQKHFNWRVGQR